MQTPAISDLILPQNPTAAIRRWVLLVVATLAASGLEVFVLLAGRGSSLADKEIIKAAFHDFLVVHVDLSAVAWFLGICLLFWAMLTDARKSPVPFLRGAAKATFALGCLGIAISPLLQNGVPLMSNYIPVYTSPLFFCGLGLLATSLVLGLVDALLSLRWRGAFTTPEGALAFGIGGSAYIILLALMFFFWSYARIAAPEAASQDYYELLFWAGGHILQFAYGQLLLVAWLWLAQAAGLPVKLKPALLGALFLLYPIVATTSVLAFVDGSTPYNLQFFTDQMRHGNIAATLLGAYLVALLLRHGKPAREHLAAWVCLACSFLSFLFGGILAFMISGSNTIIPGHYHGSIVGMTVAFMGVIYLLLPKLGYGDVLQRKLTLFQPILYVGGTLIHAIGLAVAGSYDTQRKTVGIMADAPEAAVQAMKLARHGGSLAILGGGIFVVLVMISYRKRSKSA
ncbi:MAG: hypothetical protein FJX23_08335 [Alphaproteobacteria bacterium]|nr:hypothetical protein [Alphaproteobacteria bacterium]